MNAHEFASKWQATLDLKPSSAWVETVGALYAGADLQQREFIRSQATSEDWGRRLATAWADVHDNARTGWNEHWIRLTLVFGCIDDGGQDFRDELLTLCRLFHEGWFVGVDVDRLMNEVASFSAGAYAELLRGFTSRTPEARSLKSFGLKWVVGPRGPYVAAQACTYPTVDNISELRRQNLEGASDS